MQKTHKNTNLSIILNCPSLNISENIEAFSPQLQKIIDELTQSKKLRKVIYSSSEFLEEIMEKYDKGEMTAYGIHGIGDLVNYLYQNYDIRKETNPEEELQKTSLRTKIYQYKDLNKTK